MLSEVAGGIKPIMRRGASLSSVLIATVNGGGVLSFDELGQ